MCRSAHGDELPSQHDRRHRDDRGRSEAASYPQARFHLRDLLLLPTSEPGSRCHTRIPRLFPTSRSKIPSPELRKEPKDVSKHKGPREQGLAALREPGCASKDQGLSSEWESLQDRLRGSPDLMYGIARLVRYCSDHRIAPEAVSDAVAEDFLVFLRDETFVKRPEVMHRRCLVLWNKCAATIAGWPNGKFVIPNNRATYCLPWCDFPPSLREDVEAWLEHLANADPLSLDGPAWPARPATINTRRFQVRQLISALVQTRTRHQPVRVSLRSRSTAGGQGSPSFLL